MYSVGCENWTATGRIFGISPLQLPRSWWRLSWSAVWNTIENVLFCTCIEGFNLSFKAHLSHRKPQNCRAQLWDKSCFALFHLCFFFLRGLLVVRLSPLIFLTTEKLWKVYQLIWINNSQFICCLETRCFVCAISGFVISHEIFCSNVCDYKQPLQPWELVKTLHIF